MKKNLSSFSLRPLAFAICAIGTTNAFAQSPSQSVPEVVVTANRVSTILIATQAGTRFETVD